VQQSSVRRRVSRRNGHHHAWIRMTNTTRSSADATDYPDVKGLAPGTTWTSSHRKLAAERMLRKSTNVTLPPNIQNLDTSGIFTGYESMQSTQGPLAGGLMVRIACHTALLHLNPLPNAICQTRSPRFILPFCSM
jgi:hypothetical protein